MEEEESRLVKPLVRSRDTASTDSAEGGADHIHPLGPEDPDWPGLPGTPEKPPHNRRRTVPDDEPDTADVQAQMELHALIETAPKPKPKARRFIGLSEDETDVEMDAPKALPEGELRVRSRHLQRTRREVAPKWRTLH